MNKKSLRTNFDSGEYFRNKDLKEKREKAKVKNQAQSKFATRLARKTHFDSDHFWVEKDPQYNEENVKENTYEKE